MNLKSLSEFCRVSFENAFRGCFSDFTRRIAGYLMSENGKEDRSKHKNDLIVFF